MTRVCMCICMWMVATVTVAVAACDGGAAPEPQDALLRLDAACTQYAAISCQKNLQCAPPAQPDCEPQAVTACVSSVIERGTFCAESAAAAIEGCTPVLEAMTCEDYCQPTSTGSLRCSAPYLVSTDASAPYEYSWDTTLESNGSHELKGKMSYGRHQAKDSKLLVTVLNPLIPTQEEETMIQESPELIEE